MTRTHKKIGFILQYPFHVYVFKNIVAEFQKQGRSVEFIIDPTGYYPVKPTDDTLVKIRDLLEENKLPYREFFFEDFLSKSKTSTFLSEYEALVSTWYRGLIADVNEIKKIFVTYGAGKELTTFGFWKKEFDLCLSYGDYDHAFFKQLTQSVIVGNPKFDDWFLGKFDEKLLIRLRSWVDTDKKTVLYLPTHSDLSSLDLLTKDLLSISKDYNVIVKLHYYTSREQPHLVQKIVHSGILVLEDDSDLITLLKESDIVLSDNSSAIFDAMLAEKPIVVTDFHSSDYLDKEHQKTRIYRRGAAGALTYSNSIEQRIKKENLVVTLKKDESLRDAIEAAFLSKNRDETVSFVNTLFKYKDGGSSKRAFEAIIQLLEQKEAPPKPFLAVAVNKLESERFCVPAKQLISQRIIFFIYDNLELDEEVFFNNLEETDHFSLLKEVVVLSERYSELENKCLEKRYKIFRTEDFLKALNFCLQSSDKIIFLESGVSFFCKRRPNQNNIDYIENIILSSSCSVSSGFVSTLAAHCSSSEKKLMLLEKYQSYGFGYLMYGSIFPKHVFSKYWNSGVDDPRFFILETAFVASLFEKFREKTKDPYQLLLCARLLNTKNGGEEEILSIEVCTEFYSKGFLYNKLMRRSLFEANTQLPASVFLKRFLILFLFIIFSKFKTVLALPYLIILFIRSCLVFFVTKFYLSLNSKMVDLSRETGESR